MSQTLIVHGREVRFFPAGRGTAAVYQTVCECGHVFNCIPEKFTAESRCVYCELNIDLKAMWEYFAKQKSSNKKKQKSQPHLELGDVDE